MILIAILLSAMWSCENYRYEIPNVTIDAKILGITNECIGIQYEILGFTVLEDICDLRLSQISFIKTSSVDDVVKINVNVVGTDVNHTDGMIYYYYFLGGEKIGQGRGQMPFLTFAEVAKNHPNFKWKIYDGVETDKPPETEKDEKSETKLTEVDESKSEEKSSLPSLKVQ